jgi:MFS-type transporter involved in bile tolerance (Atg22 family)
MFGLAMVGKFIFGFLADVLPAKRVFLVNLAIMAAGALILATMRADLIWYSLALFGLGWGGLYTMIQLLAVNAFGLSSAGKILGTITLLDATTAGLGIWVTAKIFDITKSYHIAFSLICALIVLALLAATLVRDERARASAT